MNFFRKLWLSLGQPIRAAIRTEVRMQVETTVVKVVPALVKKIDDKIPGSGVIVGAIIAQELLGDK